jgi:hypothetical protein
MEDSLSPHFVWGIFDNDGKVSLEVLDTGGTHLFKIETCMDGSHILLTDREARCILEHLKTAVIYLDQYMEYV